LHTEKGPIRVKLFAEKAQETVNNFVFPVREGCFDGTTFYRIIKDNGYRGFESLPPPLPNLLICRTNSGAKKRTGASPGPIYTT
jgi:hypothetical protein